MGIIFNRPEPEPDIIPDDLLAVDICGQAPLVSDGNSVIGTVCGFTHDFLLGGLGLFKPKSDPSPGTHKL